VIYTAVYQARIEKRLTEIQLSSCSDGIGEVDGSLTRCSACIGCHRLKSKRDGLPSGWLAFLAAVSLGPVCYDRTWKGPRFVGRIAVVSEL
jgi:hypothetical protein